MKIGLIDCDRKTQSKMFPNLPLMKLSAWHKSKGDEVGWYDGTHHDVVYASKVFSFSPDPDWDTINANFLIRGGSGFAITLKNGKEVYHKELDYSLPCEIDHIYPDYSLYWVNDTAYGFLQKGCPRKCDFCHVKSMQGTKATKVADLKEFWNGQKNIVLLDPNITACPDWEDLFQQLIDSGANIDFSQGLDIRTMTAKKTEMLMKMKIKQVHFAWDRYEDKDLIVPKLEEFKRISGWNKQKVTVYILTNFNTTLEQDIERAETVRNKCGFTPYIMIYDKEHVKRGSDLNKLARWVNWKQFLFSIDTFEEYKRLYAQGKLF